MVQQEKDKMKSVMSKTSQEKKTIYFVIGLFVLNAFGPIPIGVIGAYTAEPIKIITQETQDDGTILEITSVRYYHEELRENLQTYLFEFFRYSLPLSSTGYFVVTIPDFSYDYIGVTVWIMSLASIPLMLKYTTKFSISKRIIYVYLVIVQLSGMWALSHVNFECISFIDYPIRPGPPCGA